MPQPDWKTCRADDAEGLQGTCEHHGPQAGSSSRLVATAIGRCSSEGQPLVALDCQPSLPRGAEELFCDSLRTQDLTGSSEALLRVRSSYDSMSSSTSSHVSRCIRRRRAILALPHHGMLFDGADPHPGSRLPSATENRTGEYI